MRYNTGNPVGADGSSSPFDLHDNSGNIDVWANDRTRTSWPDRLGVARKTFWGMEQQVNDYLARQGFEPVSLDYVDGTSLTVDRPTQLIQRGDNLYSVRLPASFPVSLSGTWTEDQNLLVAQVDRSFEESLGGGVRRVESVSQLQTLAGRFDLDTAYLIGYYSESPGYGDGPVYWDASSTETPNPGSIFSGPGGPGLPGRWKRPRKDGVQVEEFGVRNDGDVAYRSDNTDRLIAAIRSLRSGSFDILQYIGGTVLTAYTSGVLRFGKGVFALEFDRLDFTQEFGLTFEGQGGRGHNQAVTAATTLLFSGASSGFGVRFFGNGAREGRFSRMDICYADANFTGDLIDNLSSPGMSLHECRLGCYGGTVATRVQTARSLVRSSFDELMLFDRVVFDGTALCWWSDDTRTLAANTFGGSVTRFRDCHFYDFTQAAMKHSGARTRQGLVIDNCGFNPINVAPVNALDLNNVEGLEIVGGHCAPSTGSIPTDQWFKLINVTGNVKGVEWNTSKPGTFNGMITITGCRTGGDTGFILDGGVIVAHSNEISSGAQGYIILPSIPLAVDLGPDLFKAAVTQSYYVPSDSTLLSGKINYNLNNDASSSKLGNTTTRITFRNLDEQFLTISTLPANGTVLSSGRTYNITAPSGIFTLPAPMPGCKLRVQKPGATSLTIAAAPSTNFLTGAAGTRTSAAASTAELGSCLEFEALSTATWVVTVIRGSWTFT